MRIGIELEPIVDLQITTITLIILKYIIDWVLYKYTIIFKAL